jgi:hypothetical protein
VYDAQRIDEWDIDQLDHESDEEWGGIFGRVWNQRQASKRALSPKAMATQPSRVDEQDRKNNINARAQMKTHEDRLGISLGLS